MCWISDSSNAWGKEGIKYDYWSWAIGYCVFLVVMMDYKVDTSNHLTKYQPQYIEGVCGMRHYIHINIGEGRSDQRQQKSSNSGDTRDIIS